MTFRTFTAVIVSVVCVAGCTSFSSTPETAGGKKSGGTPFTRFSAATCQVRDSVEKLVIPDKDIAPPHWDWASTMPLEVPRSEMVAASIPTNALRFLAPQAQPQTVRLVSAGSSEADFRIVNVDGHRVRSCADVLRAVEAASGEKKVIQIDVINTLAPEGEPEIGVQIYADKISALSEMIGADQPAIRIIDEGNPAVLFRERGVVCKLGGRVERSRGILHVVVSVANCWGEDKLLPAEVQATCDGQPLHLLSVAETLELLYGDLAPSAPGASDRRYSFAETSGRDDLLTPTNYRRIEAAMFDKFRHSRVQPVSAFASIPGHSYPGPAALADARALSGFLLQRHLCRVGDPEHTGWVVFAGTELKDGGAIDISIDLGQGLWTFRHHVPAE